MKASTWIIASVLALCGASTGEEIWRNWLSQAEFALFPTLPIAAPLSENKQCQEDSRKLIFGLRNRTLWAAQMWDSSATGTFGVLQGNKYHLGNYDECISVKQPIRVQYCLTKIQATVHLEEAFQGDPYDIDPEFNATVWKKFQDSRRDHTKYARDESQWGLCVPLSCNATEMEKAINLYLRQLNKDFLKSNGTTYQVEVPENYCFDGTEDTFSYGEMGFWIFTWLLIILVGIATGIDLSTKKKALFKLKATKLLMFFSLKQNIKRFTASEDDSETEHLKLLHGVKCTSAAFIVLDHHVAIFLTSVMFDRQKVESGLQSPQNIFIPHGDLLVDTFFYISGFLLTYFLFNNLQKRPVNVFLVIIQRLLRLAPLYFYIVWFQASAFLRFGSGPVWRVGLSEEVEFCQKNWWANVLFIQNYVNAKEMCMLHAWYIPADVHFFIIGVFLIILINKNKKIGLFLLHVLTLISIIMPGIVAYINELQPIITFNPKFVDKPRMDPSFELLYVKSHTRATVYFLGMLTAYYLFEKRKSTRKISMLTSVLTCFLGLALLFAPMVYGSLYYNPRKKYNLTEATIFAILRRLSWGLAWVLFMIVNRFGIIPIFGKIFTWKISVPLSKVTYGVYLIHFLLQMADEAKAKIPYQFIPFDLLVKGTSDLFIATAFAIVLYLIIELPFRLIFKELLFSSRKEKLQLQPEPSEVAPKPDPNSPTVFTIKL